MYFFLVQDIHDEFLSLPEHLQDWYRRGERHLVSPRDNMSMFTVMEGEGPETLMLLHGLPCSSYDYHRVLPILTKEFRVVVVDLPGFGFSDKPKQVPFFVMSFSVCMVFDPAIFLPIQNYTYSIPNQAEMILSLILKLDLDSAHVMGFGMSAPLVEEILARRDRGMLPGRYGKFFKVGI